MWPFGELRIEEPDRSLAKGLARAQGPAPLPPPEPVVEARPERRAIKAEIETERIIDMLGSDAEFGLNRSNSATSFEKSKIRGKRHMKYHSIKRPVGLGLVALTAGLVAACDQGPTTHESTRDAPITVAATDLLMAHVPDHREALLERMRGAASTEDAIAMVNAQLAEEGLGFALDKVEYVTRSGADFSGQTVFRNDRTKRLTSRWVPSDERRAADGDNITQLTFDVFADANFGTPAQVDGEPSIDASFDTFQNTRCSSLNIVKRPDSGVLPSAIFGGDPFLADISTIGFLPGFIFDAVLFPGASENVLGVTFTFIFIDGPGGPPTDIDNNGLTDTALKEIWYNDDFLWTTNGGGVDIETVALHENGHALEMGHFGRIARTNRNGKLHVSPRAVMNAVILGDLRELLGTDNAAFCGNFAQWPN